MDEFLKYQQEIANIQYTINLLTWELKIIAPINSKDDLVDLITYHEKKLFELQTADEYGNLLKSTIKNRQFKTLTEQGYLNNLLKHYENYKKIPTVFYENYTKTKNKTNIIWQEAKEKNDYSLYEPYLEEMISLTKQYYKYIDDRNDLYDVMLNEYEVGLTTNIIDKLFNELKILFLKVKSSYN